uniref:UPAR/Ly6 domain-containing protein n=2 Tax=Nothobranchius furzeri TaxID=105023 RepID=A0A8C6VTY1_NOTFU
MNPIWFVEGSYSSAYIDIKKMLWYFAIILNSSDCFYFDVLWRSCFDDNRGLFLSAHSLKCYECTSGSNGTCPAAPKDCPSQVQQCGITTITTFTGGSKDQVITAKKCSAATECVGGSVNFGSAKTVILSQCCTLDLCNTKVSEPKLIPNGNKCYSCEGQECTRTLNCEGEEDHCIKARVTVDGQSKIMKGCASKTMCLQSSAQFKQYVGPESICCQGDYCNSASRSTAGLLLWLVSLMSASFFY